MIRPLLQKSEAYFAQARSSNLETVTNPSKLAEVIVKQENKVGYPSQIIAPPPETK